MALKRPNVESEYSTKTLSEFTKCYNDPVYFIKTYVKIQHPTRGSVPFELYDYQLDMLDAIHNNKDTIMLCSRQMGKCVSERTKITIVKKPNWIKKAILFLVDRHEFNKIGKA